MQLPERLRPKKMQLPEGHSGYVTDEQQENSQKDEVS